MTEQTGMQADTTQHTPARSFADWLRYVPPVAALGTAFVMQVVVVTEQLGAAIAKAQPDMQPGVAYLLAALLGVAVASCAEGGAAYLMDLYDKHLLARDSVWMLRLAMAVYVGASAGVIHWWADQQKLPDVMSWVFAGMSGSALFLWARGARWRNRQQMIAAGQIDPALPRLPMAAKVLHPLRWAWTLWLISWEPATTTDEARTRYQQWKDRRSGKTARTETYVAELVAEAEARAAVILDGAVTLADQVIQHGRAELAEHWDQTLASLAARTERVEIGSAEARRALAAEQQRQRAELAADLDETRRRAEEHAAAIVRAAEQRAADIDANAEWLHAEAVRLQVKAEQAMQQAVQRTEQQTDRQMPVRRQRTVQAKTDGGRPSTEQLADTLAEHFPDSVPGRPKALEALRAAHGSCSPDRAVEAIAILRARRNGHAGSDGADQERLPLTAQINGKHSQLAGAK